MTMEAEQTAWLISHSIPTTDTTLKYSNSSALTTHVVAIFTGRGQTGAGFNTSVSASDGTIALILQASSFYYESGGQTFDTGKLLINGGKSVFVVENAQTYAGYVLHVGYLEGGAVKVGEVVQCMVDYERRALVAPNHTMTHVLNYALRAVLLEGCASAAGMCEQKVRVPSLVYSSLAYLT